MALTVNPLSVGPILGHTTASTARIFGRATAESSSAEPRRAHGVVQIGPIERSSHQQLQTFKMNPNFDMTGLAVLDGLQPDTKYRYRMGWIFSERPTAELDFSRTDLDWSEVSSFEFRTGSRDEDAPRTIVAGSCRYALRLLGTTWWDDRGDKTFRSILKQKTLHERRIDMMLMCGDQIYADDMGPILADTAVQHYFERYRRLFTTRHLRDLMAQVPTYMTLDDHEIENDWPEHSTPQDRVTKHPNAMHAYAVYQASHSPLLPASKGRLSGTPSRFWYTFRDGCCDIFVTDTRNERWLADEDRRMIGPNQMSELLNWLVDGSGLVKILVTSVPLYEHTGRDKWNGFIAQRDRILEVIRKNQVKPVLVISGDVHASMASELLVDQDAGLRVVSVVASPFFWPYPHWDLRPFHLKDAIRSDERPGEYIAYNATKVCRRNGFGVLRVDREGVLVEFLSRKGEFRFEKWYPF